MGKRHSKNPESHTPQGFHPIVHLYQLTFQSALYTFGSELIAQSNLEKQITKIDSAYGVGGAKICATVIHSVIAACCLNRRNRRLGCQRYVPKSHGKRFQCLAI